MEGGGEVEVDVFSAMTGVTENSERPRWLTSGTIAHNVGDKRGDVEKVVKAELSKTIPKQAITVHKRSDRTVM